MSIWCPSVCAGSASVFVCLCVFVWGASVFVYGIWVFVLSGYVCSVHVSLCVVSVCLCMASLYLWCLCLSAWSHMEVPKGRRQYDFVSGSPLYFGFLVSDHLDPRTNLPSDCDHPQASSGSLS